MYFFFFIFPSSSLTVSSICVFPPEFVGEYILHRSLSYVAHHNAPFNSEEVIQYSSINITSDLIFPFGQCIARNNSNYIVVLRCDHKSPSSDFFNKPNRKPGNSINRWFYCSPEENPCYRCFNLQLVSKNIILLIHNEIDINSKCSSSPESVRCPEEIILNDETATTELEHDFRSIVLFSE